MALQLGALRDALLEAGATPEKAERAAEEVAAYETRLGGIETRLGQIEGRLIGMQARIGMLTWAVGINIAATLAVLTKLLTR